MRPDAPRPVRQEPREIVELRTLGTAHPELADAVAMQIELVAHQRRLQARIPTPVATLPRPVAGERLRQGNRLVDFDAIPLDWSAARQAVRATADILHRHNNLDAGDHAIVTALVRDALSFETFLKHWYAETAAVPPSRRADAAAHRADYPGILDQVCALALRPFLARSAEALSQGVDLTQWMRPYCPMCGAEPEFAAILGDESRLLTCGRCEMRWPWLAVGCPWCLLTDRTRLRTFTSPDRLYRVVACDDCRRYLKAYDTRSAARPVLPNVDTIATLPLDAALMQQGYG
jgi:Protein involved in formate dehydrogenase formation